MITKKGQALFYTVYGLVDLPYNQWDAAKEALSQLSRMAATHRHLCDYACSGDPIRQMYGRMDTKEIDRIAAEREAKAEKRLEKLDDSIEALVGTLPSVRLERQHDPRGSTVKLIVMCDDGIERTHYIN
jgi:hypothetical protein